MSEDFDATHVHPDEEFAEQCSKEMLRRDESNQQSLVQRLVAYLEETFREQNQTESQIVFPSLEILCGPPPGSPSDLMIAENENGNFGERIRMMSFVDQ